MNIRDTYLACWNETDPAARETLLDSTWAPTARYVDPLVDVEGIEAVSGLIGAVHGQYPGFVFSPVGDVDSHHSVSRFQWGLGMPGDVPVVVGFDVVTVSADGRIETVAGFLDKLPS